MLNHSILSLPNTLSLSLSLLFLILSGANINLDIFSKKSKKQEESEERREEGGSIDYGLKNLQLSVTTKYEENRWEKKKSSYGKVRFFFLADYERMNPVTAPKAIKSWIDHLETMNLKPKVKKILKSTVITERAFHSDAKSDYNQLYDSIYNYAILSSHPEKKAQDSRLPKQALMRNSILWNNVYNYSNSLNSINMYLGNGTK